MKRGYPMASWIVAAMLAASLAAAGPAHAFEASLSGQVNQLVMWASDGENDDFFIADNDNSSTRFRFKAKEDFDGITAGIRFEMEAERNSSSKLTLPNTGDGNFNFNDRYLEAYFQARIGKFSIGKGDGAANGTSETDLSGTSVIMYSGVNDTAGDFSFVDSTTRTKVTKVDATRDNFDGLSRNERLRYDTPQFGGFSLAGSFTNGDAWELGGTYAAEFAGHKIAASVGYVDTSDRESGGTPMDYTQIGASASWLAPFGLNLTAAWGQQDFQGAKKAARQAAGNTTDATNYYVKLGYKFDIHAIAVEYGQTNDLELRDDESSNYGLAYVVKPWKGIELYAAGRVYNLDRTGADLEDIRQVMAGTRIKF